MKRKRILFLISSLGFGGAEKQTVELINRLDSSCFAVTLAFFAKQQALRVELLPGCVEEVCCLEKVRFLDLGALKRLKGIVEKCQPEVVVCVNLYPSLYAHLVRFVGRGSFRIIQVMHTTLMRSRFEACVTRLLYAPLANRCDKIVFVCRNQLEHWVGHLAIDRCKSVVIHNGIDTDHFSDTLTIADKTRLRQRYGIGRDEMVVAICAALRPEKRHLDLVRAGKLLKDRQIPVKLLMVGDGSERAAIEAGIAAAGLDGDAVIAGFQADVRPFIAISDVVALTSSSESFSMAVLEAMAMGKLIVASNVGGIPEQVLEGENGFLFPAGGVEKLAEVLQKAVRPDLLREMGNRSRALVCDRFTVGQMVRQYTDLLENT